MNFLYVRNRGHVSWLIIKSRRVIDGYFVRVGKPIIMVEWKSRYNLPIENNVPPSKIVFTVTPIQVVAT